MRRVQQDGHAARLQVRFDGLDDVVGQGLLVLQATGEDLDHARQLGDAHHLLARQIGDIGLAQEGGHVVLAVALDLDVAQDDHVVIAGHVLEGARQLLARVGVIAVEPFAIGVDHALGRVDQARTLGIVAGPGDQGAHRFQRLLAAGALGRLIGDENGLGGDGAHETIRRRRERLFRILLYMDLGARP
ncbi:hypothetical protein D3C80_1067960 [compost metagenome]